MSQIVLQDSDSQLARLVDQSRAGEDVTILRDNTPAAKIVALPDEEPVSHFGNAKDILIYMADDFDAPLEDFDLGVVRDDALVATTIPPLSQPQEPLKPGFGSGKYALIYMADDFDAPLEDFKGYM